MYLGKYLRDLLGCMPAEFFLKNAGHLRRRSRCVDIHVTYFVLADIAGILLNYSRLCVFYDQSEHKLNISAFRNLAEVLRLSAKMLAYYAC